MDTVSFTPLEESVSFYTRNDFAIMNQLLLGDFDGLWKTAMIAYGDNRGIVEEYERGERSIESDYDVKWLKCLKGRLLDGLDDRAKETILRNAKSDISNLLDGMRPAEENLFLYRTAWIDEEHALEKGFAYSREYKALQVEIGSIFEIRTITSCSRTPYREQEDVGSDFYRYEIRVPGGMPVLELDRFITHNEDGEVLLPPMKCRIAAIRDAQNPRCRGIIELEVLCPLERPGCAE